MPLDLIIVDDLYCVRTTMETLARKCYNLRVESFETGLDALAYLTNTECLPRGYLIDMRTADHIHGSREELQSPLEIFCYLWKKGRIEHFRFYTGHISEHDQSVLNQTGAQVIIKGDMDSLHLFFSSLRDGR